MPVPDSFPRQHARTRGFSVGAPRTFRVAADGSRVVFLRSASGEEPPNDLWVLDLATAKERLVAEARSLLGGESERLPEAEQARRERVREVGAGIVAYDADLDCTRAVVALAGRLFLVDLVAGGEARPLAAAAPGAYDPRLAPDGRRVAYVAGRSLRVIDAEGNDRLLAEDPDPDVSWGSADFVAAEEMGRTRAHWWGPESRRLAVERVDVGPVNSWYLADPTNPEAEPVLHRYPAAGTANATVSLAVLDLDGNQVPVGWDDARFPYLVDVRWDRDGLLVVVQTRDQRELQVLRADPDTGETVLVHRQTDGAWVDIVPGAPQWLAGRLLTTVDDGDTRRLALDGEPVTPPGLHIRRVAHVDAGTGEVLVTASEDDPTTVDVYRVTAEGKVARLSGGEGVSAVLAAGGDVVVLSEQSMDVDGAAITVRRNDEEIARVASNAQTPLVRPHVSFAVVGDRKLHTALLVPSTGSWPSPLPVLMDPYGGPHHQRVMRRRQEFLTSQWLADQGFAVVVVDGRGTPGRGPAWEREVHGDLAGPVLEDQVDALHALAAGDDRLDLGRVAIRGWSFGGYLAALAVLRRPDVFHAAIAGAPVTDWSLYDTHYTERYLGTPTANAEAYGRSSILADAAKLDRPLLLIHGLLDDNVVAAHTFRLSRALVEACRPHRMLPLPGTTHMALHELVTENLLRLQVEFLREALGVAR